GAALVDAETSGPSGDPDLPPPTRYRLHPGVAEAVRAATPPDVRAAVDTELAAFWATVASWAERREDGEDSQAVVRAGLSAAPYLLRVEDWETAAHLLDGVLHRDNTPGVCQAAAVHLRRIADATRKPTHVAILGRATARTDPAAGERLMRTALEQATAEQNLRLVSSVAADLINLLRE